MLLEVKDLSTSFPRCTSDVSYEVQLNSKGIIHEHGASICIQYLRFSAPASRLCHCASCSADPLIRPDLPPASWAASYRVICLCHFICRPICCSHPVCCHHRRRCTNTAFELQTLGNVCVSNSFTVRSQSCCQWCILINLEKEGLESQPNLCNTEQQKCEYVATGWMILKSTSPHWRYTCIYWVIFA